MKFVGDIERMNLATGERYQRVVGDGESRLMPVRSRGPIDFARLGPRRDVVFGPAECEPTIEEIAERANQILKGFKMHDEIIRNAILDAIAKEVYGWHHDYLLQVAGFATKDMAGYGQDDNAPDEAERDNLCKRVISEAAKAIVRLKDPIQPCAHDYKEERSGWGKDPVIKCICGNCGHRSWEREQQLSVENESAAGAGI